MSTRFPGPALPGLAPVLASLAAHQIAGNRFFPVTLAIDDPGVNDELVVLAEGTLVAEMLADLVAAGLVQKSREPAPNEIAMRHLVERARGNPAVRQIEQLLDDVVDCLMRQMQKD
jgi:hypothetical protein